MKIAQYERSRSRLSFPIIISVIILSSSNVCFSLSTSSFKRNINRVGKEQSDDSFDIFVKLRAGIGTGRGTNDVVFWTGEGELYESPSGKMLAKVDGVEVSKACYLDEDHVRVFSRKIFWYRDCETNEIITQYNGMPVKPIKYDWQVFDFERGINEKDPFLKPIIAKVVRSPRVLPVTPITPRIVGTINQIMFQVPVFFDLKLPGGRGFYRAWEFYDYFIDTCFPSNRPPSLAWTRNGPNPPFIDDDRGVMHFHAYRVNSFGELPEAIQSLVENNYSLFRAPPKSMEEIDRLVAEAKKSGT